jgi:hypothetical protein
MLLCAQGLCPAKTAKTWAGIILPSPSLSPAAKTSYALQPHNPALFWPVSPEAALLTEKQKDSVREKAIRFNT